VTADGNDRAAFATSPGCTAVGRTVRFRPIMTSTVHSPSAVECRVTLTSAGRTCERLPAERGRSGAFSAGLFSTGLFSTGAFSTGIFFAGGAAGRAGAFSAGGCADSGPVG
jgi:hypothetical protein